MASPRTIRTALAARLRSISGLTVHPRWPNNLIPPCAVIDSDQSEPEQTFAGTLTRWTFPVQLYVPQAPGFEQAQDTLDALLATSSTGGIYGAIAADRTLGGAVDTVFVKGHRDYGLQELAEGVYVQAAVIDLEVWST